MLTQEQKELLFDALVSAGWLCENVTINQFSALVEDVLPPGEPDPDDDRRSTN